MGLTSAGYYGHVFWDADTWMFPALLLAHPDIARSMVMFRVRTLDAAKRNARANGFRGAMYPWEADDRGQETTHGSRRRTRTRRSTSPATSASPSGSTTRPPATRRISRATAIRSSVKRRNSG
jgi:trehalose/maltose hydrolase-like predicted phosphorylase